MKGRRPKPPELRQRRNKSVTAATLTPAAAPPAAADDAPQDQDAAAKKIMRAPNLPKRDTPWHPRIHDWWRDIWRSPMASQWLESDRYGLELIAILRNEFLMKPSTTLAAEIRQQEARFGLSNMDRHRLQWEIEKPDETATQPTAKQMRDAGEDPRKALKAV